MKPAPREIKRSTLRRVIRAELMANWKLRLYLSCGHVVIVTSTYHGENARCYECGRLKNLEYQDEM